MWTCVEVELNVWSNITVHRPPLVPLSKPAAMVMPTATEMTLRIVVEVEPFRKQALSHLKEI